MKRLLTFWAALAIIASMNSCDDAENDGKTRVIQDSLVNVLPTWQALKIKVDDNKTNMHIVVGDATFYKASDDVKNKKADELAKMILRIYGKDNYLEKGTLIITADIRNKIDTPADGVSIPIDFSALKKTMGQ